MLEERGLAAGVECEGRAGTIGTPKSGEGMSNTSARFRVRVRGVWMYSWALPLLSTLLALLSGVNVAAVSFYGPGANRPWAVESGDVAVRAGSTPITDSGGVEFDAVATVVRASGHDVLVAFSLPDWPEHPTLVGVGEAWIVLSQCFDSEMTAVEGWYSTRPACGAGASVAALRIGVQRAWEDEEEELVCGDCYVMEAWVTKRAAETDAGYGVWRRAGEMRGAVLVDGRTADDGAAEDLVDAVQEASGSARVVVVRVHMLSWWSEQVDAWASTAVSAEAWASVNATTVLRACLDGNLGWCEGPAADWMDLTPLARQPEANVDEDVAVTSTQVAGRWGRLRRVVAMAAGDDHTCVLLEGGNANGAMQCFGGNQYGQLGYGFTDSIGDNEPALGTAGNVAVLSVAELGDGNVNISAIATGSWHTCALLTSQRLKCWGWGAFGQLGFGDTENVGDNEAVASMPLLDLPPVLAVAAGGGHTCVILVGGGVRCWGLGSDGRLGYGDTALRADPPEDDVDVGMSADRLTVGEAHTCILSSAGAVRCWGYNWYGQLVRDSSRHAFVQTILTPFTKLADHRCAGVRARLGHWRR
jgi:Regulator of chromosome condensation (RCC1) repeat